MRFSLPESDRQRKHSPAGTLLSALVHLVAIGGTVAATAMSAEREPRVSPVTEQLVYVKPPAERSAPRAPTPPTSRRPVTPPVTPPLAPPRVPAVPVDAPEITPVISANVPTALPEPSALLEAPNTGGVASHRETVSGRSATGGEGGGTAWHAYQVEREVVALRGVTPRYPETLSRAGIEGTVIARFVVDTAGRVEGRTIEIARADHALFEQSVREALSRMRFAPAQAGGRHVRQLVEQPFTFALRGR